MWQFLIAISIASVICFTAVLPLQVTQTAQNVPVSPTAQESVHIVKAGDDLADLAEKYYGNRDYWTSIWNDNPEIIHPNELKEGMKLKIRTQTPGSTEDIIAARMEILMADSTELDPELAFVQAGEPEAVTPTPAVIAAAVVTDVEPTIEPKVQAAVATNYDPVYMEAGEKYGVPWQILYGLHLTETGQRDGEIYSGYGSGAQGPMQFMPGTWRAYGVDGNGDGVADINNAEDAIHGAANYLAKHGTLDQGLRSYGGNTSGTLAAACRRGYCQ